MKKKNEHVSDVTEDGDKLFWRGTLAYETGKFTPEYERYLWDLFHHKKAEVEQALEIRESSISEVEEQLAEAEMTDDYNKERLAYIDAVIDTAETCEAWFCAVYPLFASICDLLKIEPATIVTIPEGITIDQEQGCRAPS